MRTTAYTHTESDHRQYSNHNALGGELQAAGPPIHRAEYTRAPLAYDSVRALCRWPSRASYSPRAATIFNWTKGDAVTTHDKTRRREQRAAVKARRCSHRAAEDRQRGGGLVALAGRHDFPSAFDRTDLSGGRLRLGAGRTQHDRSLHGDPARDECVGRARGADPDSALGRSARKLALPSAAQDYRHIRRMVLELQGHEEAAAQLR